jgi:hypothetical protein
MLHVRSLLPAIAAGAFAAVVHAQAPRLGECRLVLPATPPLTGTPAIGDVDGDGRTDFVFAFDDVVVFGAPGDAFRCVRGAFTPPLSGFAPPNSTLADIDGDGDLDLLAVAGSLPWITGSSAMVLGGVVDVYANDGAGAFTFQTRLGGGTSFSSPGERTALVVAGDLDGDTDLDVLAFAESLVWAQHSGPPGWNPPIWHVHPGRDRMWRNVGNGQFQDATASLPSIGRQVRAVALADLDLDGDHDVVIGNATSPIGGGSSVMLRNSGNGTFTIDPQPAPVGHDVRSLHAHDVDGDLDVDVIANGATGGLYRNSGNGTLTFATVPLLPSPGDLLAGDFDGDGRVDYGVRAGNGWSAARNLGNGFAVVTNEPAALIAAADQPLFAADFEQDGDTDLFAVADALRPMQVWRHTGLGAPAPLPGLAESVFERRGVAVVDLDGDGAPDLLGFAPGRRFVLRNDRHGRFEPRSAGAFTTDTFAIDAVATGDLDGDGAIDVVVAGPTVACWYRNLGGDLVLQPVALPLTGSALGLALADLDGDQDTDIYCSTSPTDVVLRQVAPGTFLPHPIAGVASTGAQLVDVDGDGDLDAVVRGRAQPIVRNQGAGQFADAVGSGIAASIPEGTVAADFDGDGDIDVVAGARLWRNHGTGTFAAAATPIAGLAVPWATPFLTAADFDDDGDVDLLRAPQPFPSGAGTVFVNDGSGLFTAAPRQLDPRGVTRGVGAGDFDGDGDVDLVLAAGGALRLVWNQHSHLHWTVLPRVGRPFALQIAARANAPFVLAAAFATAHVPVPGLGTLRLDPAGLLVVHAGAVDTAGDATWSTFVPQTPALVGTTLHWQLLHGAPARLGNLESTTLLAH